jgi:heat shock protein HslJ
VGGSPDANVTRRRRREMRGIDGTDERKGDMRTVVLLVALLLAPVLAACAPKATPTTPDLTPGWGGGTPLGGTEWVLTSLNGESLIAGTEINLYFEEALLGGSMTCNRYGGGPDSGKYVATDNGALTLPGPMNVTVQLCTTPEGVMEQETAYIEALWSSASYSVVDDHLQIRNAAGETILVFARKAEQ